METVKGNSNLYSFCHWAAAGILGDTDIGNFQRCCDTHADTVSSAGTHPHLCRKYCKYFSSFFLLLFFDKNLPTHEPSLLVYPTGQLCLVIRETPLERDRIGRPIDDTSCGRSLALTRVPLVKVCPLSSPAQERPSPSSTVPGGQRHLKLPGTLRHWWAQGFGV